MFISKLTSRNGLKYHKIRYKSRGNIPIKPFQFQFTFACFLISYLFYKQTKGLEALTRMLFFKFSEIIIGFCVKSEVLYRN